MSSLIVEVVEIDRVEPHPNADRLELATVKGWNCVVQKGRYKAGDRAVYIPIDSVLSPELEAKLFPPDSKVKLHNRRIKTIKLRGAISQGLVVSPDEVRLNGEKVGTDVAARLGVTKYEPPAVGSPQSGTAPRPKAHKNPNFKEYTELENWKHYPYVFQEGEPVVVTEKIHGTNFRAGWVPYVPTTRLGKLVHGIRKLVGLERKWEFVYGSHHVQLQRKRGKYTGFYGTNVYEEAVRKYDLENRIPKGIVIYGEIYGDGIQKNYAYGCAPGERKLVVFDVMRDGVYVNAFDVLDLCQCWEFSHPPWLHTGTYNADLAKKLSQGPSFLCPDQKVREGCVVKPWKEATHPMIGRKMLKVINDEYLLRDDTTEFH